MIDLLTKLRNYDRLTRHERQVIINYLEVSIKKTVNRKLNKILEEKLFNDRSLKESQKLQIIILAELDDEIGEYEFDGSWVPKEEKGGK